MTCDIATKSNSILNAILDGKTFDLPAPDLSDLVIPTFTPITFDPPSPLTTEQLTEVKLNGAGVFDKLMSASMLHLRDQAERGSFTSDQVAKIYAEMIQASMATGVQYLLSRDQAYWAAVVAQQQAQTGQIELARTRVELEVAKTSLYVAQLQALNQEAEFALAKAKLATEETQYCTLQYTLTEVMPIQKANLTKEGERLTVEVANLTKEGLRITADTANMTAQNAVIVKQADLVKEQTETQRAQTLGTRSDSVPVGGAIGKQIELQSQQIISYKREIDMKLAKLYSDAWITMKTIDEGIVPPTNFTNSIIDSVLTDVKAKWVAGV